MTTITRRALAALAFAFVTLGIPARAEEPSCCTKKENCCASDCCKKDCCKGKNQRAATNQTAERFRAKYGRELPGTPAAAAHEGCC